MGRDEHQIVSLGTGGVQDEAPLNPFLQVEAARGGKWHAHPSCHLEGWVEAVRACTSGDGKTPLLIADDHTTYIVRGGWEGVGGIQRRGEEP